MISDFLRATGQLFEKRFRRVLLRSVGITLLLLGIFVWGGSTLLTWALPFEFNIPIFGTFAIGADLSPWVARAIFFILSIIAMFPVTSVVIGLFLEEIADAVEDRHYPNLPPARVLPLSEIMGEALRFMLLVIVVNTLAIVIYLASTLFAPIIFWMINGLLLSREYFHLVAIRRLDPQQAIALRKSNRLGNWVAGVILAIPLSIPIVNLIVPILGVAVFTHRFHRLTR